jgi:hypothetical protein
LRHNSPDRAISSHSYFPLGSSSEVLPGRQ